PCCRMSLLLGPSRSDIVSSDPRALLAVFLPNPDILEKNLVGGQFESHILFGCSTLVSKLRKILPHGPASLSNVTHELMAFGSYEHDTLRYGNELGLHFEILTGITCTPMRLDDILNVIAHLRS